MNIKKLDEHKFLDVGNGVPIVLLHGLFGSLSNWNNVIDFFSTKGYRVIVPMLPLYDLPKSEVTVAGLTNYFEKFVNEIELESFHIIGNSLGGHIGLQYILKHPEKVKSIVLAGSSGLFEKSFGSTYPKRGYAYVKEKVGLTFYNPEIATQEIIDEVYAVVNDIRRCLRIIGLAKSAQRENMAPVLPNIKTKTCLIWGLNDTVTPPMVAHDFNRMIENSELHFIDKCCHVPMMEHPGKFNSIVDSFLKKNHDSN